MKYRSSNQQTAENFYLLKTKRMKILTLIIANYEDILIKNDIDFQKLFACLKIIDTISPEYEKMLKKLNDKLNENLQQ